MPEPDPRLTFASARQQVMDSLVASLRRSVSIALGRHGRDGWDSALLQRLGVVMRAQYRADAEREPGPALRRIVAATTAAAHDALEQTELSQNRGQQVDTITEMLAVAVANGVTEAIGEDAEEPMVKTWVTMEDQAVRPAHASVHLQSVPVGEKFDVEGVEMDRPGDLSAPVALWIGCRCVLAVSPAARVASGILDSPEGGVMETDDLDIGLVPFYGVLAPEGVPTTDGRQFEVDSMRWRELPLPLLWQKYTDAGHDKSVIVGIIERIEREENMLRAYGHMLATPEADEVMGLMASRALRGVSVDVYDATVEVRDLEGTVVTEENFEGFDADTEFLQVLTDGEIAGATLVAFPAFREAFLSLGTGEEPDQAAQEQGEESLSAAATEEDLVIEFAPGTQDGPGWLTHPVDTDRLRDYWVRGAGAAKIGWGTPGDFNRCRTLLAPYVKPQYLSGYCANRHKDALGFWPGEHQGQDAIVASGTSSDPWVLTEPSLVASGSRSLPRDWFADPGLIGPSPLVVTTEGRVFGHLAAWGTCHIGISGTCVTPPHSATNYANFRTGVITTDDGDVAVGQITLDTGHAGQKLSAAEAIAHYDNTGTAVCDVAVGEDQYGIWVAGAVRPSVPQEDIDILRASAISGDWRGIGGNLELVGALVVNVPGYPIPRTSLAASGGRQVSLVAAGIVQPESFTTEDIETIVRRVLEEKDSAAQAKAQLQALAAERARTDLAAIAAERG